MRASELPIARLHDALFGVAVPSDTLPPATATNAWVLGDERVTVIDPGGRDDAARAALWDALRGRTVERVLLTHHHADHTAGVDALLQQSGARLAAHPVTGELLQRTIDEPLEDGDVLHIGKNQWRVLFTPGHAAGHIALVDDHHKIAVVGDLLAGTGTILISPPDGHLATYLESLERIRESGATTALPAHGPPLDLLALTTQYIQHRHQRTDQVREGLRRGPATAFTLAGHIYPDLPSSFLPIAAMQVRAHLTYLAERGEIAWQDAETALWVGSPPP